MKRTDIQWKVYTRKVLETKWKYYGVYETRSVARAEAFDLKQATGRQTKVLRYVRGE